MIVRTIPCGEERSEILKRSFWDRYAGVYDLMTHPGNKELARTATWIASFLRPHDRLFDAVCGTGTLACLLTLTVEFVLACDYSKKMLEQAHRRAARQGPRSVAFRVHDLRSLTPPREVFGAVVCIDVPHLLDSPGNAIAQLKMVVHPGNLIIVADYVHETGANSAHMELISRFGFEFTQDWDVTALEKFLSEQGLRIIDKRLFDAQQPLEVMVYHADDDVV